jgi:hypothetical protein
VKKLYDKHPNIRPTKDHDIQVIENPITVPCFGQTISINLHRTGEMETCFRCGKTHRVFIAPDNYYDDDVCCPVITITLNKIELVKLN